MSAFVLLLLLACPLMMFFMMRGMHGGHGSGAAGGKAHAGGCHDGHDTGADGSLDDLRRQRDELDRRIAERETEEQTAVGSGLR